MSNLNDENKDKENQNLTQYDRVAETFSENQAKMNQVNREMMYEIVERADIKGRTVLDLCCGDGIDAEHYRTLGAKVTGLDESIKLLEIGKKKYPKINFIKGDARKLPFKDSSFDSVFSKYAIMSVADMSPIFDEIHRVLKPGGSMIILCTHPIRQYEEKRETYKNEPDYIHDYTDQRIVKCNILDGTVPLEEPSHTFQEYFSDTNLKNFDVTTYREAFDPAAEQINGAFYSGFLIIKGVKRMELGDYTVQQFFRAKINSLFKK